VGKIEQQKPSFEEKTRFLQNSRGGRQMRFSRNSSTTRDAVRLPAVAGDFRGFYPSTPSILSTQVGRLINNADVKPTIGELIGLIAPHAGYAFSGHVAGNAYKLLEGKSFDTVILIGLSHRYRVQGAAIYARGAFRTPLGDIEIDEELAARIIDRNDAVVEHPEAHEGEHSLEVQLPFLQRACSQFRIVPILLQDDSPENVHPLSQAIAQAVGDRAVLLVGSTDLCHYPEYKEAVKSDRVVVEAMKHFDTDYLRGEMEEYMQAHSAVPELHCMMCSTGAVYTTMETAKLLGAERLEVLKTANSGDVPMGGRDQVVGYMAAAMMA
jgi:AmmeMemoRadiSam system protein B